IAVGDIVKPCDQVGYRALARPCRADDCERLPRIDDERNTRQRLDAGIRVTEGDIVERYLTVYGSFNIFFGHDIRGGAEKLVDALLGGFGALHETAGPTQRGNRPGKQVHVEDELCDVSERKAPGDDFRTSGI